MDTSERQPSIFVWEVGRPCHLFIEATSVRERPQLVRRIKKHGGIVVNAVREAQILLAENNTKETIELLDAWQGDKIVLGTRWVSLCIDQQRFLGHDQGWGGCLLSKESVIRAIGGSSDGEDDGEDDSDDGESRIKPVSRPKSASIRPRKPDPRPSASRASRPKPASSSRTARPSPPSNGHGAERNHSSSSQPFQIPHFSSDPALPNNSDQQFSLDQWSSSFQYPYPPSSQTSSQQQMLPPMGNILPNLQPQQMLSIFQDFQLPTTSPQLNVASNQITLNQSQLEFLNQLMFAGQGQNVMQQQTVNYDDVPERRTPDDVMSSDVVSDDEPFPPIPRKNKGKSRARSRSEDRHIQTAIRSRPIAKKTAVVKKHGFFMDDHGMSKQFYVMVDLKNRKDLLKIVKKHQGAIVSEMELADYITLNTRSNQYQNLLATLPISKVALSPGWIEACEKENRVVDIAPFVIDVTSGVGPGAQRKRPAPSKSRKVETADCESEDETPLQSKGAAAATPAKSTPQRSLQPTQTDMRSGTRSPSPPKHIVQFTPGKNIYTPEDRKWFFKYMRFRLERDPDASTTSLMKAVNAKAPHHSVASWHSMARKNWKEEMNALKAYISSLRKRPGDAPPTPSTVTASSEVRWRSPPRPSSVQNPPTTPGSSLASQDDAFVLRYPEDSSSPIRIPSTSQMPPSSLPVSQPSTQATPSRIVYETLKRKESPLGTPKSPTADDRPSKKSKVQLEGVIDVDSFPDQWIPSR